MNLRVTPNEAYGGDVHWNFPVDENNASWWNLYNLPSGNPNIIMDFVNDRYYSNGNSNALLANLLAGTVVRNANGLNLNQFNITAIGDLLADFQLPAVSVVAITQMAPALTNGGIVSYNANTDAVLYHLNNDDLRIYVGAGGGIPLDTVNIGNWALTTYSGTAYDALGRTGCLNGGPTIGDANSYLAPVAVQIGQFIGTRLFNGFLMTLVCFPRRLTAADLQAVTVAPPYV